MGRETHESCAIRHNQKKADLGVNTQLETWKSPENNKRVICEKLVDIFANNTHILEIGSGTAQHAVWFAKKLPHLSWQPSDRAENLTFILERLAVEGSANISKPIILDVNDDDWPDLKFDGIYCANCIHIMSWQSVLAMFTRFVSLLKPDNKIVFYGPFKYDNEFTTQSNADFDLWLKSRNPQSGIRDFEAVDKLAQNLGLKCIADYDMPANNQLIVWGSTIS